MDSVYTVQVAVGVNVYILRQFPKEKHAFAVKTLMFTKTVDIVLHNTNFTSQREFIYHFQAT